MYVYLFIDEKHFVRIKNHTTIIIVFKYKVICYSNTKMYFTI